MAKVDEDLLAKGATVSGEKIDLDYAPPGGIDAEGYFKSDPIHEHKEAIDAWVASH